MNDNKFIGVILQIIGVVGLGINIIGSLLGVTDTTGGRLWQDSILLVVAGLGFRILGRLQSE